MFRIVIAIFLIGLISDVRCQYYESENRIMQWDFFSAFQPVHSSLQFDITTKRIRTEQRTNKHNTDRLIENTRPAVPFSFDGLDRDGDKQKVKKTQVANRQTTSRPLKKITTYLSGHSHDAYNIRETSRNKTPKDERPNSSKLGKKIPSISNNRNTQLSSNNEAIQESNENNNDGLAFEDRKQNTVYNYEASRRNTPKDQDYEAKKNLNIYQAQYPVTIRPGVKPAIVNGPPITNRPATQRPSFGPRPAEDDLTISPELIIGPNEDYMTSVEKKRYIEMAERMCDKYKAQDIKQIQAIPLVPSPEVLKVNVSSCAPTTVPLVVGGKVVTVKEFPHMALLGWPKLRHDGYSWKCGGSLLSNRYVLTAAHCVYQDKDTSVVTGAPRAVQLGSSYLADPNAVVIKVAAVIRHPKYKLPKSYYDIAIVKMASTVTFSSVIRPACLGIPPPPGDPIIASGWGRTEFGGEQSQELRSVSIPIWEMSECYGALGTSRKIPDGPSSDSQLCAGEKRGGKDTCQGDSGGPAQIQDGCIWRVVAVTSLGRSCGAPQTPALYALVHRAFVSAVVFGDQIDKRKLSQNNNQETNNNQWNNQQWNNQRWNNQQTTTERYGYQDNVRVTQTILLSNNRGYNDENGDETRSNREKSDTFKQNSNGQHYNNNNNKDTTIRTNYNNPPRVYYNDYGDGRIQDYRSNGNPYNKDGNLWWT